MSKVLQKAFFRLRAWASVVTFNKAWWVVQGTTFGRGTVVPRLRMTWPHQVCVGARCILEEDIYFKYDGIWQSGPSIVIGDDVFVGRSCEFNIRQRITVANQCLIASGCKFIDHDHGIEVGLPMKQQIGFEKAIVIEEDVWLGFNVIVLKGVTVGRGAVIGSGAVVTKSVPPFEIWAGVPAHKISERQGVHVGSSEAAVSK